MTALVLALMLAADTPAPAAQSPDAVPEAERALLPLNSADAQALASLDSIDQSTAEAIVGLRQSRGRLGSVEELRVLPGMNDARLNELRANTTVDLTPQIMAVGGYSSADEVLAAFDHEPTVQQVQDLAMNYTHTNREQVENWLRASRNSAWLPQLTGRYQFQDTYDQDYDYTESIDADLTDAGTQQRSQVQVQVRWDLDELVMSSTQIRVISESQDVVKLRDTVLTQVTGLYFDRRRLQVDMLLAPANDVRTQVDQQLRLMELTAELDGYTGGRFSAEVARSLQGG
jgi:hypothetical protein